MKKTLKQSILLLLPILLLNACSVYNKIIINYDDATDFSKYKTFAWLPDNTDTVNLPYNNSVIHNNIKNYFGQSFAERGYVFHSDSPDLLLRISVVDTKKEKTVVYAQRSDFYYYSPYYYGSTYYSPYYFNYYYRSPGSYYTEKQEYLEGSITLEIFDRVKNKLIWTATAMGEIYDPSYINKDIHPAVCAIMKKYPVKPIKKQLKKNQK
jgi:hypothetical protein